MRNSRERSSIHDGESPALIPKRVRRGIVKLGNPPQTREAPRGVMITVGVKAQRDKAEQCDSLSKATSGLVPRVQVRVNANEHSKIPRGEGNQEEVRKVVSSRENSAKVINGGGEQWGEDAFRVVKVQA